MKKLLPIVVVLLVLAAVAVFIFGNKSADKAASDKPAIAKTDTSSGTNTNIPANQPNLVTQPGTIEEDVDDFNQEIQPATKLYKNAAEAFAAIKAGAAEYDDLLLEQFANPDESCTWCSELYRSIADEMLSANTSKNDRSYYAELLAITGKPENLQTLISAYNDSPNQENKELYLEALELTAGDENLVGFLATQLDTATEENLKESLVAALTNHGSRTAIEKLYSQTVQKGDPDGYYSQGMGLGEIIPDADTLPLLVEYASKKDNYSPLAIKALLNYGDDGLKEVVNIISASNDRELNKKLLTDALDHVSFDSGTEEYVKNLAATATNPDVLQFANDILKDMEYEAELDEEEESEDAVVAPAQ